MSDGKPMDTAATLTNLRTETADKTSVESGVSHYLRGAMTHILDLLNMNDWMGARRAAEQIHSDAGDVGSAVARNVEPAKPAA